MKMRNKQLKEMVVKVRRSDFTRFVLVVGIVVLLCLSAAQVDAQDIGPLLPEDLTLSTATVGVSGKVALSFDGTKFLVVWQQYTDAVSGIDIYGRLVGADGVPSGDPFRIANTVQDDLDPAVAFNGEFFLVVWRNLGHEIQAQLVTTTGQLFGRRSQLSIANSAKLHPDVASDGSGFLAVWTDSRDYNVRARDIFGQFLFVGVVNENPGLVKVGVPFAVTAEVDDSFRPAIVFGGGSYLVTWINDTSPNAMNYALHGMLIAPLGPAGVPFVIAEGIAVEDDGAACVAFDGTSFLVAFPRIVNSSLRLFGTRLSTAGQLLDAEFLISDAPGDGSCKVAYGDGEYLVVWASNGVKGIRVSTAGQVLDPQPANLSVMTIPGFLPGVAYGNSSHLVAWELGATPPAPYLPLAKYAQLIGPITADSDGDGIPDDLDVCPNENATGFDVNGDGCIDSPNGLAGTIDALVQSGVIAPELQTSLLAKVNNAEKSANKDNICAAINQLNALKNQIYAQRGNKISDEAANAIIAYTDSVIAYLLSRLPAGQSC